MTILPHPVRRSWRELVKSRSAWTQLQNIRHSACTGQAFLQHPVAFRNNGGTFTVEFSYIELFVQSWIYCHPQLLFLFPIKLFCLSYFFSKTSFFLKLALYSVAQNLETNKIWQVVHFLLPFHVLSVCTPGAQELCFSKPEIWPIPSAQGVRPYMKF